MLSDFSRDLRYALRTLRRTPTFTAAVTAVLAVGIGGTSAIFTAVDAMLLRDAPVSSPAGLVDVCTSTSRAPTVGCSNSSYPDYFDLRDSGTFASLTAFTAVPMTIEVRGQPDAIPGQLVTGNYFDVLGIAMAAGRAFVPAEDRPGAPVRVAIISHRLWERVFGGDRAVVGRTIRLNSNAYVLIGVTPRGFAGPFLGDVTDVWVPSALQPEVDPASAAQRRARGHAARFDLRGSRGLNIVGRMHAGTTIDEVAARVDVIARRLQAAYPDTNRTRTFAILPLGEGQGLRAATRPLLLQLAAVVALVLLVASVNVAGLLLGRALSRERELAVRVAIGAGRARLVRQALTESVLLGTLGAIGAVLVTRITTPVLHTFVIAEAVDLSVNARVLGFTLIVGVVSGLLFGMAPVGHALRRNPNASLRAGSGGATPGGRSTWMRSAFVIAQVALSLALLVVGGVFVRTLEKAYSVDHPYDVDRTLVATLNLEPHGYFEGGSRGPDAGAAVYQQILSRVEALPGVAAAAVARMTVLSGGARATAVSTDGRPLERDNRNALGVRANIVSDRYFETMNVAILRGRAFAASDGPTSPRVAIVSRSLAERLWPGQDPIGRTLIDAGSQTQVVVGVAADTVYTTTVERDRPPTYYLPLSQNYESGVTLHVRAAGSPMPLVPAIREAVRQTDTELALQRPQRLREVLDRTLGRQRMMATLVGLFGVVALLLAVCGLYGTMAHGAIQRTREIGIRLALGARRTGIVTLLLAQALRLLAIGVLVGLGAARLGTSYVETQLFGVTASDPVTFVAGCVVLALAGLAASVIPALRAMRVDPIAVLRRS